MNFVEGRSAAAPSPEPPAAYWSDKAAYDRVLVDDFLLPLREAAERDGQAPLPQQLAVLNRLHWYFTVDARPMAPTLVVDDALAQVFHRRVADVMRHVGVDALQAMPDTAACEVRHALLSYKRIGGHSAVTVDALDREQGLARLTYWVHGRPPAERIFVDGREVEPAFAKYRACRFFRRDLLAQRIAWIPVHADASSLQVTLGETTAKVQVGAPSFSFFARGIAPESAPATDALRRARTLFRGRSAGASTAVGVVWARWKASVVKALARAPFVRARFADAWVFADREHDADDNAEHLYRWVARHHPEINAWFLLRPGTADWKRLEQEGFRLIGPGLRRQLLLLNSAHVISSHPENGEAWFDRRVYGDAMNWRFTYLKHGVGQNDQSHYYGCAEFDCFITPSPFEYRSLVDDGTPYRLTRREVRLCNFPRYDRLLQRAAEVAPAEVDQIVVMPTWRNYLLDDRLDFAEQVRRMEDSPYLRAWLGFLKHPALQPLAHAHGKRIVFIPHSNLVPYLEAFDLPVHIEVATRKTSIQEHLVRCSAFVTDYTSVAFDVALLRRPVFYFQFDREAFYAGQHNWRPGYFDYERDGFGPVSTTVDELCLHLANVLGLGNGPGRKYRERMDLAMPDTSSDACARTYRAIDGLRRAIEGQAPTFPCPEAPPLPDGALAEVTNVPAAH